MKNILLVGNPNTGKTTLLNTLTKSEEHTGNWHGVTVEEKQKFFEVQGQKIGVVDLPGIYSLNALSYEEEVATNYIFSHPDEIVLNTLDINTIEKNLFLTLDLLTLGRDVVLAVNTMGEKNIEIDFSSIEKELGVKVFVLDFENKNEVRQLKNFLNSFKKQDKKNDLNKKIFSKKTYEEIDFLAKKFNANFFEIIKI
ncbi:MAG: 50S ribosome-binding GTPase, partial [Clostridia bacterium]|nr:50S ribosome-binding GTPase [Clostridia bacterium]